MALALREGGLVSRTTWSLGPIHSVGGLLGNERMGGKAWLTGVPFYDGGCLLPRCLRLAGLIRVWGCDDHTWQAVDGGPVVHPAIGTSAAACRTVCQIDSW